MNWRRLYNLVQFPVLERSSVQFLKLVYQGKDISFHLVSKYPIGSTATIELTV